MVEIFLEDEKPRNNLVEVRSLVEAGFTKL